MATEIIRHNLQFLPWEVKKNGVVVAWCRTEEDARIMAHGEDMAFAVQCFVSSVEISGSKGIGVMAGDMWDTLFEDLLVKVYNLGSKEEAEVLYRDAMFEIQAKRVKDFVLEGDPN